MSNAVEGHETTKPATQEKGTKYVVLGKAGEGAWRKLTTVASTSADAAIKAFASGSDAPDATEFVAIPERSWNPRKVNVEQKTAVTLS